MKRSHEQFRQDVKRWKHARKHRWRHYKRFPHNRLWIRLSMAFGFVLLAVMTLPILFITLLFTFRHAFAGDVPFFEPRMFGGLIFMLIMMSLFSGFVGLIAGAFVSRKLGRQVNHVLEATQSIDMNNLHLRVEERGVDELRELAASFNRMVAELERSQQTRRNLLADVSHELLTPLTVLEGNLRAMLDGVYEMNAEEISYLYDETHHMIGLVKELRELTKAEAKQIQLNLVEASINEVAVEVHKLFEPLALDQGIRLDTRLGVDLPSVAVDAQRMRQMLGNLLSNALRHTPSGGKITLKTTQADAGVLIAVQDSGDGIEADELDSIFDRFYRVDGMRRRDAGGSGLGLAIVKALVEAHGGEVSAESSGANQGSTFTIVLPSAKLPA